MLLIAALLFGSHALAAQIPFFETPSIPVVQLRSTAITGKTNVAQGIEFFGGIPFAEPPVGNLRFAPPQPHFSFKPNTTFDASEFGPSCIQPFLPADTISEDCLTVNVFRPQKTNEASSLPVLVWIYGGGFATGRSSHPLTPAQVIVKRSIARGTPVVFVNFNYRIGPFGFPQGEEAAANDALNLGLRDQQVALEWVQKNIASFGGDPDKVTVFGVSAGAVSVAHHYLDPSFAKLARAAIFQSGHAASMSLFPPSSRTELWLELARHVPSCSGLARGADTFPCLRDATASEILAALGDLGILAATAFVPSLDSSSGVVPELPGARLSRDGGNMLPFIAGTILDEGTMFIPANLSENGLQELFITAYSPSPLGDQPLRDGVSTLFRLYPEDPEAGSPYGTGNNTFGMGAQFKRGAAILGDLAFQAQRRFWSRTASAHGTPSYAYIFTEPQTSLPSHLGVPHGTDVLYVYGVPPVKENSPGFALSQTIMDYWLSFATSLTPNDGKGTARVRWEMYDQNQMVLNLNSADLAHVPDDFRSDSIDDFINKNQRLFSQ